MFRKLFVPLVAVLLSAMAAPSTATLDNPAPEWVKDAVVYEVNFRQFTEGGTFNEFALELPRLRELGVDVLWFMPIHRISTERRLGTLGSYYSVADYRSINPEFGTADDFADLVHTAHAQGFKVILDWIANHTGWDHAWISQHPDWYVRDSNDQIIIPPGTNWTDVAELNYQNPDLRLAMIAEMTFWVNAYDIDGFRLDYTHGVPDSFWQSARAALNAIKPVYLLAENYEDVDLLSDTFDSNYNWPLKDIFNNIGATQTGGLNVIELIQSQSRRYGAGAFPMNFITNHDENSWSGTEYERLGKAVPALTAVYFTLPGVPLVYTGQEVGMKKRLEFFEKDPVDWGTKTHLPYLVELIKLKDRNPALDVGASFTPLNISNQKAIAFKRAANSNQVITVVNISNSNQAIKLNLKNSAGVYQNVFTGVASDFAESATVYLPPYGYAVYEAVETSAATIQSLAIRKPLNPLKVKSKLQLLPLAQPQSVVAKTYSWKSLTPRVVTVGSTGVVKGLRAGVGKIQLQAGGLKTALKIKVK